MARQIPPGGYYSLREQAIEPAKVSGMANKSLDIVLQRLRQFAAVQTARELSDHELLKQFVAGKDQTAFAILVGRHGPMVLGVCRRALRNAHDAEDACQATFLVLARRATRIRKTTSLGSWLHG